MFAKLLKVQNIIFFKEECLNHQYLGQNPPSSALLQATVLFFPLWGQSLARVLRSHISSYSEACWSFLTFWCLKSIFVTLVCTRLYSHKAKHWSAWFHSLSLSISFPFPFIQRLQPSKPPPPIVFPHFRDFIIVGCLLSWLLSALKSQFPICSSSNWSFIALFAILTFIIFWTS